MTPWKSAADGAPRSCVAIHGIGFLGDLWSVQQGEAPFSGVAIGLVAHLIVLLGGAYYLWRPTAR